jgi:23S rRNA pseudouridine2605 synthase
LTAEQLQAAQAAHWRQNQNPILTLEDAAGWFSQHPLCLFLPRRAQLPAPAPSFVEACLGAANATPPYTAVEQANGFLARLMASDSVLALNLLGTPGEQPDFLAHKEVLPFLVSLRGERDWKRAPGSSAIHKVSPLVVELWRALEQAGPLTAGGIREKLGRELTDSAVLRGLSELWQSLRVIPVLQPEGRAATWELLEARHGDAVAKSNGTSQVTAISLLVSMYLQSVYAASGDEIEIFLSPLASRSRIREAVRGLSATRQIHSLSMETQTYYFLEDGLPKSAETELERPKAVPPRRPRVAEPKRARTGVPDWAKVAKPKQSAENATPGTAAEFAPPPSRPVPSPGRFPPASRRFARPPAAGQGTSRPRADRGDFARRKDSRPSYGKRPGNDQGGPGRRQEIAKGDSGREGFPPKRGASDSGRPGTRTKQRWRDTPGKPGYQPDRTRPAYPRSAENSAPQRETPDRKFPDRKFPDRKFQERGTGAQGFARPERRPAASGTPAPHGQGTSRTERPRPAYGKASSGGFRTRKPAWGRAGTGKPKADKPGADGARPGQTGAGWPRAANAGRRPSAWGGKAGGGGYPPGTRPSFGARSRPSTGGGGFPKFRPGPGPRPGSGPGAGPEARPGSGRGSGPGPAGRDAKRSFRAKPGGFTPGGRPGKRGFGGKEWKGKNKDRSKEAGSKEPGRKRPEA